MMLSFETYTIFTDIEIETQLGWFEAYADSLHKHIEAVYKAGIDLRVPSLQLIDHDSSKWSIEEFPHYARQFHGDKGDPNGWAGAWLHHIHHNPHHWQHWIFPDRLKLPGADIEAGVMPIPEIYALEMIADWMGASYVYIHSWDISDWIRSHAHKIILHSKTTAFVEKQLTQLGYDIELPVATTWNWSVP